MINDQIYKYTRFFVSRNIFQVFQNQINVRIIRRDSDNGFQIYLLNSQPTLFFLQKENERIV